jgi:hypothetical protein
VMSNLFDLPYSSLVLVPCVSYPNLTNVLC